VLHGQVLVTSRNANWEEHAALAELEVFDPAEAVTFLLARSGSSDEAAAAEIAGVLGLLPLASEQAGAYVRQTRLPLATYLDRLRQFPALTAARGRPRDRDPADTVATTWQVSIERVRPVPGAVALLEVCAFLGPEEIPRVLFGPLGLTDSAGQGLPRSKSKTSLSGGSWMATGLHPDIRISRPVSVHRESPGSSKGGSSVGRSDCRPAAFIRRQGPHSTPTRAGTGTPASHSTPRPKAGR
jgi:hypothetical protein